MLADGFCPAVPQRTVLRYSDTEPAIPQLSEVSILGHGQTGALSTVPSHTINYFAQSGALALSCAGASVGVDTEIPIPGFTSFSYSAIAVLTTPQTRPSDLADQRASCIIRVGYRAIECVDKRLVALGTSEDHLCRNPVDELEIGDIPDAMLLKPLGPAEALNAVLANAIARRHRRPHQPAGR